MIDEDAKMTAADLVAAGPLAVVMIDLLTEGVRPPAAVAAAARTLAAMAHLAECGPVAPLRVYAHDFETINRETNGDDPQLLALNRSELARVAFLPDVTQEERSSWCGLGDSSSPFNVAQAGVRVLRMQISLDQMKGTRDSALAELESRLLIAVRDVRMLRAEVAAGVKRPRKD